MVFKGLRIALIGPMPPPAGGMANQTRQLAELLRGEGVSVELVQTNGDYRPLWVGRIPGVRALSRLLPYLLALWRACGRNQLLHVMANSGWSWHLFAAPAIWMARLRGCALVVNYHGGEAAAFLARSRAIVAPSLAQADVLTVPSGFLKSIFAAHGLEARIVPNIVDLSLFCPQRDAQLERRSRPHLVVLRNLELIYDNANALRAFGLVRQRWPLARLSIAGSGPELFRLQSLAQALELAASVTFCGTLDRAGIAGLLAEADLCINPSLADNTPVSVIESLASGVAVVSTDVGGISYLLQHQKTALLVPPGDPLAMAKQVLALLDNPPMRRSLIDAGLVLASQYSWAEVGPQLEKCYLEALAR